MAFSLNRSQVIGNVTRDPELRQTGTGQTVASFSVATNRRWKDANGEWQDKADFHNIVAWSKLAEIVGQYVKKGRKIYVEGRMQTNEWAGEDGQKRYRTEIVAENIILLDRSGAPEGDMGGEMSGETSGETSGTMSGGFERKQNTAAVKPAGATTGDPVAADVKEEEMAIDDLPF